MNHTLDKYCKSCKRVHLYKPQTNHKLKRKKLNQLTPINTVTVL